MLIKKIKNKHLSLYNTSFIDYHYRYLFCDKINVLSQTNKNIIKEKLAKIMITIKRNNLFNKTKLIRLITFLKIITGANIKVKRSKIKIKHKIRNFILVFYSQIKTLNYSKFINFLLKFKFFLEKFKKNFNRKLTLNGELQLNVSKRLKYSFMFYRFIRRFKRIRIP
jgi:uncharacterized protein YbcI